MEKVNQIRILNLHDVPDYLPHLAQWHQTEWSYLNPGEDLRARIVRMQQYLTEDFIPSTYVAVENELLGSAAIVAYDMDIRLDLSPWLASVYVAPAHRRRGVARALIGHVMEQARRNGVERLYLFTPGQYRYYTMLGWDCVDEVKYRGTQVTIMSIATDCKPGIADHV